MAVTSTIELHSHDPSRSKDQGQQQQDLPEITDSQIPVTEFASLPPVDTGKQAWLFLAACWGVEAVTFGQSSELAASVLALTKGTKDLAFPSVCSRTISAPMNRL